MYRPKPDALAQSGPTTTLRKVWARLCLWEESYPNLAKIAIGAIGLPLVVVLLPVIAPLGFMWVIGDIFKEETKAV